MTQHNIDAVAELRRCLDWIEACTPLPGLVFKKSFCGVRVIEFDALWSSGFFEMLRDLSVSTDVLTFAIAVIEPNPETYFYQHFRRYPVEAFSITSTARDYIEAVNRDPGDSPADAIIHISNILVIRPENNRWCIYGDREADIGIIAVRDRITMAAVKASFPYSLSMRMALDLGLVSVFARDHATAMAELEKHYGDDNC